MPISPLLSFPLMLATYKITVQRKLISVQCLLLESLFEFHYFPPNILFFFGFTTQFNIHIIFHCSVSVSSSLWWFPILSLFFMTLILLMSTGQSECLSVGLCLLFSHGKTEVMHLGVRRPQGWYCALLSALWQGRHDVDVPWSLG